MTIQSHGHVPANIDKARLEEQFQFFTSNLSLLLQYSGTKGHASHVGLWM